MSRSQLNRKLRLSQQVRAVNFRSLRLDICFCPEHHKKFYESLTRPRSSFHGRPAVSLSDLDVM